MGIWPASKTNRNLSNNKIGNGRLITSYSLVKPELESGDQLSRRTRANQPHSRKSRFIRLATLCQSQTATQSPASIRRQTSWRSSVTRSVWRRPV
jgi:hypothetical protein